MVSTERPDVVSDKVKSLLLACARATRFCVDTCQSPSAYVPYYVSTWNYCMLATFPLRAIQSIGFLHYALHVAVLQLVLSLAAFSHAKMHFCQWSFCFCNLR